MDRIYLSAPDVAEAERTLLLQAFDSNWIAPLGEHVDAFEAELAAYVDVSNAVALSSGTAGLHLALLVLGVGPGDFVLVPDLTFVATANAVAYVGACPVFVDCTEATWTVDPALVVEELDTRARSGTLPKAVITVDLYGQCADYEPIVAKCSEYGIPIVEDAAEALGASYCGDQAGALGTIGVFSFNGNKIITTSGGGMFVSSDDRLATRARHLSNQAREPVVHFEHRVVGYNYRLSNLLAAIGRAQLSGLPTKLARRREINALYRRELEGLSGMSFMPEAGYGRSNCWLTCLTIDDPIEFGASRDDAIAALNAHNIEARPVWKPMHLQPAYASMPYRGTGKAAMLFSQGLCLPSGSGLTDHQIHRVADVLRSIHR